MTRTAAWGAGAVVLLAACGGKPVGPAPADFAISAYYTNPWAGHWEVFISTGGAVRDEALDSAVERAAELKEIVRTGRKPQLKDGSPRRPIDAKDMPRVKNMLAEEEATVAARRKALQERLTEAQRAELYGAVRTENFDGLPEVIRVRTVFDAAAIGIRVTRGGKTRRSLVVLANDAHLTNDGRRLTKIWCAVTRLVPPEESQSRGEICR